MRIAKNHFLKLIAVICVLTSIYAFKPAKTVYEFQNITTVESVIPGGLGRSRMISSDTNGQLEEKKLKNFFSLTGINFNNIKKNDRDISEKLAALQNEGWELTNVTSGVYSSGVTDDLGTGGTGIFITRYLFRRRL